MKAFQTKLKKNQTQIEAIEIEKTSFIFLIHLINIVNVCLKNSTFFELIFFTNLKKNKTLKKSALFYISSLNSKLYLKFKRIFK